VRECWATIVLQRTKQWIGIDLIAWSPQPAVITADIVTLRAGAAINVSALGSRVVAEDSITKRSPTVNTATQARSFELIPPCSVAADRAIADCPTAINTTTLPRPVVVATSSGVAANGAVSNCSTAINASAPQAGEVETDCAACNCECSASGVNAAAVPLLGRWGNGSVPIYGGVDNRQRPIAVDAAAVGSAATRAVATYGAVDDRQCSAALVVGDWLDAVLETPLRARRGRRLTPRGRGYFWCRCVTLPGKAFLQLICDSLFDHVLNGIGKRR